MLIICPHCQNSIAADSVDASAEVLCPACGSSFRLVQGSTVGLSPNASRRLGRFELLQEVGRGAFGSVYKARDTELDRIVAVKVPRAAKVEAGELDRLLREARSAAQLRHPSIVPVHEVGLYGASSTACHLRGTPR